MSIITRRKQKLCNNILITYDEIRDESGAVIDTKLISEEPINNEEKEDKIETILKYIKKIAEKLGVEAS